MQQKFDSLKMQVEAVLFTAETALEASEIRDWIGGDGSLADIRMALRALAREYENRAFSLVEIANKYQLQTRLEHIELIKKQYAQKARSLSKNALETLSIIAYRQPITKAQINAIRQHDSSSIMQTLKEKNLIYASGMRKEVGNPIEYRTTDQFLEVFNLKNLSQLPNLRSLQLNIDEQKNAIEALKSLEEPSPPEPEPTAAEIGYLD